MLKKHKIKLAKIVSEMMNDSTCPVCKLLPYLLVVTVKKRLMILKIVIT